MDIFAEVGEILLQRRRTRLNIIVEVLAKLVELMEEEEAAAAICRRQPMELVSDVGPNGKYSVNDFAKYLKAVDCYNEEQDFFCRQLLSGIDLGLKHHTLNCISFTDAFPSLIGMKKEDFFVLLVRLQIPLQQAFPASPIAIESSSTRSQNTCEIRFKVFIVVYRLRHAMSFNCLEGQFGWSASVIHEWWTRILRVFHVHLRPFHRGFLAFRGHQWQLQEITNWKAYHEELVGDYQAFLDRIEVQNNANPTPTINKQNFVGSIGAVDGTYSVVCRISEAAQDIDEDGLTLDRMYTSYKRCHAYKLVLTTTHLSKFIIALEIAPGSSSDATVYNTMVVPYLMENLHEGAALLGDNAFHSSFLVITPFPTNANVYSHQALVQAREAFNHNHSKDRMASEHGNCQIKSWAIVRGRTDHVLFEDEREFVFAVEVCWGIHNWLLYLKESF